MPVKPPPAYQPNRSPILQGKMQPPPVYKPHPMQQKSGSGSAPPVYNPDRALSILAKMQLPMRNAHVPRSAQSPVPMGRGRSLPSSASNCVPPRQSIVQRMKREMYEQSHNYIVPDQPGWYQQHVKQRVAHAVNVTLRVLSYHYRRQAEAYGAQLRRATSSMSPNAEAQAAQGIYIRGGTQHDAAHLMNVTVRTKVLSEGQHLDSNQQEGLDLLREMSAATTMQLKSNNVGPDKAIDRCITIFTQRWATHVDSGNPPPKASQLITDLATACRIKLLASKKAGTQNYQDAIAGAQQALSDAERTGSDVDRDVELWLSQYQF